MARKATAPAIVLPETIKVGPFVYRVVELPAVTAQELGILGDNNSHALEIRIRVEGMSPQRIAEVALHEVLHSCWLVMGLEDDDIDDEVEEDIVNRSALGLLTVMRDNPDLMPWIQSLLEWP